LKWIPKKKILFTNDAAISEEFTSLPALSLIMIGIVLFSLLIFSTYDSYGKQTDQLSEIEMAEYILAKCLDPDLEYMLDGSIIDMSCMRAPQGIAYLENLQENLFPSGLEYTLSLHWDDTTIFILSEPPGKDQLAVSQSIGIALNPVDVYPGAVTIIIWANDTQGP